MTFEKRTLDTLPLRPGQRETQNILVDCPPKNPQKGAKFPGMHEVCKYWEICKGKCSLMISMNSPEVYETGSLNIRRECVCWLTGDAVAASTWRCSITANISVIPGCYIKRLAVSPWIGQEVSGGLCSAPVKGPHMPLLSSFRKCTRAQHTCTDAPSKPSG